MVILKQMKADDPVKAEDGISNVQINNETTIDENAWNLAVSAEYKFLGILGVSVGYNFGNLGVNECLPVRH